MKLPMLALVAALALAPLVAPLPALAQHGHGEHAAHAPSPVLAEGERWATDAPLRIGMAKIRTAVDALQHYERGHMGPEQAVELAARGIDPQPRLAWLQGCVRSGEWHAPLAHAGGV